MIQQAHIIGTGSSMPERILSNKDLETIVDTTDEWIVRRSGIKDRRISSNEKEESTADLATQASLKALEMAEISPVELKVANEDIGKIIGKQGRTVRAIRTILGAASAKMKKRSSFEIIE